MYSVKLFVLPSGFLGVGFSLKHSQTLRVLRGRRLIKCVVNCKRNCKQNDKMCVYCDRMPGEGGWLDIGLTDSEEGRQLDKLLGSTVVSLKHGTDKITV